jgi:hypothetical protein
LNCLEKSQRYRKAYFSIKIDHDIYKYSDFLYISAYSSIESSKIYTFIPTLSWIAPIMAEYNIPNLPLTDMSSVETKAVLKKTAEAHRYLAELKGVAATIPNEAILINTLALQEAKGSSERQL